MTVNSYYFFHGGGEIGVYIFYLYFVAVILFVSCVFIGIAFQSLYLESSFQYLLQDWIYRQIFKIWIYYGISFFLHLHYFKILLEYLVFSITWSIQEMCPGLSTFIQNLHLEDLYYCNWPTFISYLIFFSLKVLILSQLCMFIVLIIIQNGRYCSGPIQLQSPFINCHANMG